MVRLDQSPVEGWGVFAETPFRAKSIIGEVNGYFCRKECPGTDRCIDFDGRCYMPGAPFRCLNHSPSPNCGFWVQGRKLILEANRRIEAGEELLIDYGWESYPWLT